MPRDLFTRLIRRLDPGKTSSPPVDMRSRRFVAVIDCILNQNARDAGAASFPAMNIELLNLCNEHSVGLLQMPCPEIAALGLRRTRAPGLGIRAALDTEEGQRCCIKLAAEVGDRVAAYIAEGYQLIGVLGGNPLSPGCAVHHGESGLTDASGLFMQALQAEFVKRGWLIPFQAIRDADQAHLALDLQSVRTLIGR